MTLDQPSQPSPDASEQPQQPTPQPISLPLSDLSTQPLTWLWPQRIPQGKLTLLDGAPGCGTTLFAVTLAACVSNGLPWPDGTPCLQGNVLLIAPYDNFRNTLLPRLKAAGARDDHVMSLTHIGNPSPTAPQQTRPFSLSQDFALLESIISSMDIVLLILDPFTAIPGWRRALPALIDLAERTHCAIVLTRSLSRAPADPLHPHCPASPVLTAARSHLLLAPNPADDRHCLLLTPKHSLCAAPSLLAYTITLTEHNLPIIGWLPAPDPTHLRRLSTGPIRSPQRQAILHFLRERPDPCTIKDILVATSYDYEAGRKMLWRMQQAGELVSLGQSRYTTAHHPCLAHVTPDSPSPSLTSSVPTVPGDASTSNEPGDGVLVRADVSCPSPMSRPPAELNDTQTDMFNRMIASGEEALAQVKARLLASGYPVPTIPLSNVPCPNPDPPQNSSTILPQAAIPTSKRNIESVPDVSNQDSSSHFVPWGG